MWFYRSIRIWIIIVEMPFWLAPNRCILVSRKWILSVKNLNKEAIVMCRRQVNATWNYVVDVSNGRKTKIRKEIGMRIYFIPMSLNNISKIELLEATNWKLRRRCFRVIHHSTPVSKTCLWISEFRSVLRRNIGIKLTRSSLTKSHKRNRKS